MQAIFPPGNTAAAMCSMKTLFVYIVFLKLIGNTQTAIHPAGSDEILFQRVINLSVQSKWRLSLDDACNNKLSAKKCRRRNIIAPEYSAAPIHRRL
jgi:hypothetical protein